MLKLIGYLQLRDVKVDLLLPVCVSGSMKNPAIVGVLCTDQQGHNLGCKKTLSELFILYYTHRRRRVIGV